MKFVADLHLHSKYSRAVSQNMTLPNMAQWAKIKGINVLATGDFTHPFWLEQLKNELEDAGNGLFKLRESLMVNGSSGRVASGFMDVKKEDVYFMLSCEISSIYSQGGKTRRIHTLFFFPALESVEKFNKELIKRGSNLRADGRPIVGITSDALAEIALICDERALIIPAHAWTPWFSIFGSFSGFDSIEECFGKMAKNIYGVETGLSSDPGMNWQIEDLDNRSILSFSDAHSLEKMGREATVFEGSEMSYDTIYEAITGNRLQTTDYRLQSTAVDGRQSTVDPKISFTIEFYPEEGKYHFTGHRDCNFSQGPEDSKANGTVCPVCKKPLTVGVMDRVEELKVRNLKLETRNINDVQWIYDPNGKRSPFVSLVPLGEIIAEVYKVGVGTKKVTDTYITLVNSFGSEFAVLMRADLEEIKRLSFPKVAEAVSKVRSRDIVVEPGYDNKFGVVKIWQEDEDLTKDTQAEESQLNLFA